MRSTGGAKTFSELISSEIQSSADTEREIMNEFEVLVEKFTPILENLKGGDEIEKTSPILKAIESLEIELYRARAYVMNPNLRTSGKRIESMAHDLGRLLGLVLFASVDVSMEIKLKIEALQNELKKAKFDVSLTPSQSQSTSQRDELEIVDDFSEAERDEIVEDVVNMDEEQMLLQLKYGEDDEFKFAISRLIDLIKGKIVHNQWINDESVIPILFNRLRSCKANDRVIIIRVLRSLASYYPEFKDMMGEVGSLSTLAKSLTQDIEERREAVGLLLSLSDIQVVSRRIGRIQGCIVMMVAIFNGEDDDSVASRDAGKLLNAMSSNTQNALLMAEAGYFKPLVHHLKEGSDMSKILMATLISRMELTDQACSSLGQHGTIPLLIKMLTTGKLEAKLSSLNALQNLSATSANIQRLIDSGIVTPLLQLLFSVTSVLMTLREPASAILARIAQSESILANNDDVAHQMVSLLNLSNPVIQNHLLQALNSIASHSNASKVRRRLTENGALQVILPFLNQDNLSIRSNALDLLNTLSKQGDFMHEIKENHLNIIISIVSSSTSDTEKASAIGFLSNIPITDKITTNLLKRENLLPVLVSLMSSNSTVLAENITGVLLRFTTPSDKKLQMYLVEHGVIPLLVKVLSFGSSVAKSRAATSLSQLSMNSLSLKKSRKTKWLCVSPSIESFCEIHDHNCSVKTTFCLAKAGAIPPLINVLSSDDRGADEAVLDALATFLQDEICENGSNFLAKTTGGVEAVIKVLKVGTLKVQVKAIWILERVFRDEAWRVKFGEFAQVVLIDLLQNSDLISIPIFAKLLAQLDISNSIFNN